MLEHGLVREVSEVRNLGHCIGLLLLALLLPGFASPTDAQAGENLLRCGSLLGGIAGSHHLLQGRDIVVPTADASVQPPGALRAQEAIPALLCVVRHGVEQCVDLGEQFLVILLGIVPDQVGLIGGQLIHSALLFEIHEVRVLHELGPFAVRVEQ